MTSANEAQKSRAAIRSPVYWSLLGLLIERPDYGYSLVQRFKRAYGEALALSSDSHVYTGLDVLVRFGLIEEYESSGGGRSRLWYRATADAPGEYAAWLSARIAAERLRDRLFARQLAALAAAPELGLEVIDRYERACLESTGALRRWNARGEGAPSSVLESLAEDLSAEQARLSSQAELPWVSYARARFTELGKQNS